LVNVTSTLPRLRLSVTSELGFDVRDPLPVERDPTPDEAVAALARYHVEVVGPHPRDR